MYRNQEWDELVRVDGTFTAFSLKPPLGEKAGYRQWEIKVTLKSHARNSWGRETLTLGSIMKEENIKNYFWKRYKKTSRKETMSFINPMNIVKHKLIRKLLVSDIDAVKTVSDNASAMLRLMSCSIWLRNEIISVLEYCNSVLAGLL